MAGCAGYVFDVLSKRRLEVLSALCVRDEAVLRTDLEILFRQNNYADDLIA